MNLSVAERLGILSILPVRGDYITLKVLNQLRMNLSFTEDELKDWGIVEDKENKRVSWNSDEVTDIPIGEVATGLIAKSFKELDKRQELPVNLLDLYEKFIPTTE